MNVLYTVGMTPSDFDYQKEVVDTNNNIHGKCDYFFGLSATGWYGLLKDGENNLKCTSL